MPQSPDQRDAFETSVATARSVGATVDEVRQIHDIVKKHPFPEGVRDFEVRFGADWSDAPAAWIVFLVNDDAQPSQARVSRLTRFGQEVQSDLLGAGLRYWPYVDFRVEAPVEQR